MKVVIQRVKQAQVKVDHEVIGKISSGLLVLVCFEQGDEESAINKCAEKIGKLRIFDDPSGKMNLNIHAIKGEVLSISQFTLSWDGSGGHRPSFENSMPPQEARFKYALFNRQLRAHGINVSEGKFGASMEVSLINDGPVTFILQF
jgi:D-tyrosyl-tRNA(Tyr) deacylase